MTVGKNTQQQQTANTARGEADMAKNDFEFYTVEEVMQVLDIKTKRTIYDWIRTGRLKAFKAGREWRVTREAMDEYITQNTGKRRADAHPRTKNTAK